MRVLLCFDVDGTLETSAGPITVARLRELDAIDGCQVVIVSPSGARPQGFAECINGPSRAANLESAATTYHSDLLLYISDNNDQAEAQASGFTYIDRMEFR